VLVVEERGRCKFVSGAVDLGESKRNAAVRELAEETGLPANTFRRSPEHGDVKDDAVTAEHVALTYVGGWNKKRARRDVNDNVSCFKVVVDGDCFKVNPHPKDGELQKVYWMSLPKVTLIAKHYTAFDATGKFAKTAAEAEKKKTEGADVAAIETAGKDAFKDSMTRSFADVGLVYTNPWYTEPLVWVNNLAAGKEMAVGRMGKDGDVW
jgi:ADP-ribose pyrophosphatase YjhB (NUDIX family)